jgi:hypothetical protein
MVDMAIKRSKRSHWSYCVHGRELLRCYTSKALAIRSAKSHARRRARGLQVFVEKVRTNPAGVHNQYAKGAKVVWVNK